jgi:uncharacterized protein (TIRG00374 family)
MAIRRTVVFVMQLLVSGGLIALLFSMLDVTQAMALLRSASPVGLVVLLLLHIVDRVLMAYKWDVLLASVNKAMGLYHALRVYYISAAVGIALPIGGLGPDIVRFLQTRRLGLTSGEVASSMVVERALGLASSLATVVLAASVLLAKVPQQEWHLVFVTMGLGSLAGLSVLLAVIFHAPTRSALLSWWPSGRSKPDGGLARFQAAISEYAGQNRALGANFLLSLVEQFMPILILYVGAVIIGIDVTFVQSVGIVPVAMLLQRLPISYLGLGVREGVLVALLALFGVDYTDALTLTVLLFIVWILSVSPGAFWALPEFRDERRRRPTE